MSIFGKAPVQDIARGRDAFADHLRRALKGRSLDDVGWAQPDDLTLHSVPLFATTARMTCKDAYMLRLYFDHYPSWPPSALFVNPLTLQYSLVEDAKWAAQRARPSGDRLSYQLFHEWTATRLLLFDPRIL